MPPEHQGISEKSYIATYSNLYHFASSSLGVAKVFTWFLASDWIVRYRYSLGDSYCLAVRNEERRKTICGIFVLKIEASKIMFINPLLGILSK